MLTFNGTSFKIQGKKFQSGGSTPGWVKFREQTILCEFKPHGLLLISRELFGVPVGHYWNGDISHNGLQDILDDMLDYGYLVKTGTVDPDEYREDIVEAKDDDLYDEEVSFIDFLASIKKNNSKYVAMVMKFYAGVINKQRKVKLVCEVLEHPLINHSKALTKVCRRFGAKC